MRRILVLSDLWPPFPGGAERLMFNLARDLHGRGHVVGTVTGYEHARQFDGPPVLVDDAIGVGVDRHAGALRILDAVARFDPDVILTHHLYAHEFEPELSALGRPLIQVVLNGQRMPAARLAVYISRFVMTRHGDAVPGDLVLTPPAMPDVVADSHGDAIGFIKPIVHKGVDLVYRIADAMPERRFVILRGEWQDLEVIEAHDNVEFMEPVVDIRDFWRRVRVVLVPSYSEDAGTVGQEAAANGVPCISSKAGGLVETNGGGIRLATNRVGRWVRAIRDLDGDTRYQSVVASQSHHLAATDHAATLDELAARVEAM